MYFKSKCRVEVQRLAADEWRLGMTAKSTLEEYRRWKAELVMEQSLEKENCRQNGRFDRVRVQGKRLVDQIQRSQRV